MILTGSISGAMLLISYFKRINVHYITEGIYVGITWFIINIILDLLLLIPMSGMPVSDYFLQIGLRYLVIPVMSIMAGVALAEKSEVRFGN